MDDRPDEDFYVQRFHEKRDPEHFGKRHDDNHNPPCLPLRVLAGDLMHSRDDFKELKELMNEFKNELREFKEEVSERISKIETTLSNQRSFLSGAGWLLGLIAAFAVWALDKFNLIFK